MTKTNSTLGEFDLLKRIGRGAMSEVFLAKRRGENQNLAIKVMDTTKISDDSLLDRFSSAAELLEHIPEPAKT